MTTPQSSSAAKPDHPPGIDMTEDRAGRRKPARAGIAVQLVRRYLKEARNQRKRCGLRRRRSARNQAKELCGVERQIYMARRLFRRDQTANGRRVVIGGSCVRQTAGCLAGVNRVDQVLGSLDAGAAANRAAQSVIDRLGTGQVLLTRRPLDILAAMAVTQAH